MRLQFQKWKEMYVFKKNLLIELQGVLDDESCNDFQVHGFLTKTSDSLHCIHVRRNVRINWVCMYEQLYYIIVAGTMLCYKILFETHLRLLLQK